MMQLLLWLPVIALPAVNMIIAIASDVDCDVRGIFPWILGAAAEELFFRFFLLKKVLLETTKLKPTLSIFLVSMLFAAMHLFNLRAGQPLSATLAQVFAAFCFSIWAGAVMWKKGDLLIPLLAHVLLNLSALTEGTTISLIVSAFVLTDGFMLILGEMY